MQMSIVIPAYNAAGSLKRLLPGIIKDVRRLSCEILLVNDGSEDDTEEVCLGFQKKYSYVRYFFQNNKGVSAARNLGIKNAKGKYIAFLDADDELEKGSVKKLIACFDKMGDQVDLLTYPLETRYAENTLQRHFRYDYLKDSGVYDLQEYPYIGQTTINVVVKNRFENNILFDEAQNYLEDQRYCCDVLKDKLKMGFCAEAKYIYHRDDESTSGKLSGSCYIFEQCMDFYEKLFEGFQTVPAAFQGLFIDDLDWKLHADILYPYHYEKKQYENAVSRVKKLLARCDVFLILNHPRIDFFEKYYWLRMKGEDTLQCKCDENKFSLYYKDVLILEESSPELVVTGVSVKGSLVRIRGFLKSVFFQFFKELPLFCAEEDGGVNRVLPLQPSFHNYYLSKEPTQRFWAFDEEFDASKINNLRFKVALGNYWYGVHYYFMPLVPFSHPIKEYVWEQKTVRMEITPEQSIRFQLRREAENKRIWLYYDCHGVPRDNGMNQYLHDYHMNDGIERYYVISDTTQEKQLPQDARTVLFGGKEHRSLFLRTDKILTAFIEPSNIIPFSEEEWDGISNRLKYEVVYLQHGVLHIEMPWKYTADRILADKIVVSTKQEKNLWLHNGFREKDLLCLGMPRFKLLHDRPECVRQKRILFAPSWRGYLTRYNNRSWSLMEKKYRESAYFRKLFELLSGKELADCLKRAGYQMDVKFHPIFRETRRFFPEDTDVITYVDEVKEQGQYSLFITDFSSWLYDFLYLKIPVIPFIPDNDEFKCGMNGYRSMNPEEADWSKAVTEADDLLQQLEKFFETNQGMAFHADFYDAAGAMDNIYNELMKS